MLPNSTQHREAGVVAFYGLRYDAAYSDEIVFEDGCPLDPRGVWPVDRRRLEAATRLGLSTHIGQLDEGASCLMVGERLGHYGADYAHSAECLEIGLRDTIQRTRERLAQAGLQGDPALHLQVEDPTGGGMESAVLVIFYGVRVEADDDEHLPALAATIGRAGPDIEAWLGRAKDAQRKHLFLGEVIFLYGAGWSDTFSSDDDRVALPERDLLQMLKRVRENLAVAGRTEEPALHVQIEEDDGEPL